MFNGHIDTVSLSSYEDNPLSGKLGTKDGQQGGSCVPLNSIRLVYLWTVFSVKRLCTVV